MCEENIAYAERHTSMMTAMTANWLVVRLINFASCDTLDPREQNMCPSKLHVVKEKMGV
jgi:hypothetical protein